MKQNQTKRLLSYLQKGKVINRLDALLKLGIFELSARICEIEKLGVNIHKERKKVTNRFGEEFTIVHYSIEV